MNIEKLKADLDLLVAGAASDRRDAAFFKRILVRPLVVPCR